jgi:hypothetical protein
VIDVLRCVYERFELAIALLTFVLLEVGARDATRRAGSTRDAHIERRGGVEPVFGA